MQQVIGLTSVRLVQPLCGQEGDAELEASVGAMQQVVIVCVTL